MARYIDADKLIEHILTLRVVTDNMYGMGITRGIERAETAIQMQPTADVIPKSEADTWYQLYHSIKEELKLEKMYHRETENLCDRYCIESQQAKKQVAREIFEEINKIITPENHPIAFDRLKVEFSELKKKYTEGKDE